MHPSVIEFRDRLLGYASADAIPLPALRADLLSLHRAIEQEDSRVELRRLFNVIADLVENHLSGDDLARFQLHRRGQIWLFLRAESLVDGELDRARLKYVTDRETAAGRLSESDEIRRYALGDEQAFDAYQSYH